MTDKEAIEFLYDLLSVTDHKMKHKEAVEYAEDAIEKQSMVNEILNELREYSAIGTLEEFKALKEKSEPKKATDISKVRDNEGYIGLIGKCHFCDEIVE